MANIHLLHKCLRLNRISLKSGLLLGKQVAENLSEYEKHEEGNACKTDF